MYAYVAEKFPRLKSRVTFLLNEERIGAFANKDSTIKENCPDDNVVIDIDADDGLVGRQTFNVFN